MKNINKFKEICVDVLVKTYQIVFAVMVIGQIVSGKFDTMTFLTGIIACILCIIFAMRIALSIKKEDN